MNVEIVKRNDNENTCGCCLTFEHRFWFNTGVVELQTLVCK